MSVVNERTLLPKRKKSFFPFISNPPFKVTPCKEPTPPNNSVNCTNQTGGFTKTYGKYTYKVLIRIVIDNLEHNGFNKPYGK